MPPTQRANIVATFHQADARIVKAQQFLARIHSTLIEAHPEDGLAILAILTGLEGAREYIREVAMPKYTRTPRSLCKPGDLVTILAEAKPLPRPNYASQQAAHRRTVPSQQPAYRNPRQRRYRAAKKRQR